MKRFLQIMKWFFIITDSLLIILIGALSIYTIDAYKPLDEMYDAIDALDTDTLEVVEYFDVHIITPTNPIANIIIIPGGKVYTESYLYLAYLLALEGYQVHLTKALFHLAILTPTYTEKFLSSDIDNILIGHTLGGTVASLIASGNNHVEQLILLASYSTGKVTQDVLLITAEFDLVLNEDSYTDNLDNYTNYEEQVILGGNHAGFGWYGYQQGDGVSTITIMNQQQETVNLILDFLNT